MSRFSCESVRELLNPFVDHELSGAAMLQVSRHLEGCISCAGEAEALSLIGDRLREARCDDVPRTQLDVMASNVVVRVRAESAVSWMARFERAVDDTRLLWVGTGAFAGAMATMLIVAAALFFGRAPEVSGSARATQETAGTLFVIATRESTRPDTFLVQVSRGESGQGRRVITEAALVYPTESELVGLLAQAVTRQGHIVELSDMPDEERKFTESLLDQINRRQSKELVPVTLQQLRLVTTADVSAKGL